MTLIEKIEARFAEITDSSRAYNLLRLLREALVELKENKEYQEELARDLCQLQDALGCPPEMPDNQKACMERIRDLIEKEGQLGDLQEICREVGEKQE